MNRHSLVLTAALFFPLVVIANQTSGVERYDPTTKKYSDGRGCSAIGSEESGREVCAWSRGDPDAVKRANERETLRKNEEEKPGFAQSHPPNQLTVCGLKGEAYKAAAYFRDQNIDPKQALDVILGQQRTDVEKSIVTKEFVKTAINHVYFDANFTYARGQAFADQMRDICLNGSKKWAPLK